MRPAVPLAMGLDWSSPEEREPLLQPARPPGLAPQPHYRQHGEPRRSPAGAAVAGVARVVARGRGPPAAPAPSRVYGQRWLVLLLFSLLGFVQGLVWNTWGPIQNSARQALAFSSLDIALLVFWGPIGFVPSFVFMWLMDKKGKEGGGGGEEPTTSLPCRHFLQWKERICCPFYSHTQQPSHPRKKDVA